MYAVPAAMDLIDKLRLPPPSLNVWGGAWASFVPQLFFSENIVSLVALNGNQHTATVNFVPASHIKEVPIPAEMCSKAIRAKLGSIQEAWVQLGPTLHCAALV